MNETTSNTLTTLDARLGRLALDLERVRDEVLADLAETPSATIPERHAQLLREAGDLEDALVALHEAQAWLLPLVPKAASTRAPSWVEVYL